MARLAKALLAPINTSAIIILGFYTILWGLWVINPLWSVFGSAAIFSAMGAFMPEWVWGLVAIVAGSLTTYGVLKPSYPNLTRGAIIAFLHWTLISIFYLIGDWHNTGGITALTFALYAAYIYVNIRVNRIIKNKRSGSHENGTQRTEE